MRRSLLLQIDRIAGILANPKYLGQQFWRDLSPAAEGFAWASGRAISFSSVSGLQDRRPTMQPQRLLQICVFLGLKREFRRTMIAMVCVDGRAADIKGQIVDGTQWAIRLRINVDSSREENGTKSI